MTAAALCLQILLLSAGVTVNNQILMRSEPPVGPEQWWTQAV